MSLQNRFGQEEKCLVDFPSPKRLVAARSNIMITGNAVAVLKDKNGNLKPDSAAEASLFIVVKGFKQL